MPIILLSALLATIVLTTILIGFIFFRFKDNGNVQTLLYQLLQAQQKEQHEQRERFDAHQLQALTVIQDSLKKETQDIRLQMETKLNDGFKKTNETFFDIAQRLTIIDEAQKKITELSSGVLRLQEVLTDKRSRGAFGEVQLNALIRNMLPEQHFALQHELSNKTRVDCLLFLPDPTGNIPIDAKFPLENFQRYIDIQNDASEKQKAKAQFAQDIRKHIKDIATKYIIAGETADSAMLFIPAEAIFAEIHSYFPDLVETAHQARVWLVSPTTLMAVLTTARAVIKDVATRKQVHIIQEHLIALGKDFSRFQDRMHKLSSHINQAQHDAESIHESARKITSRFHKIERVDIVEIVDIVNVS